MPHHTRSKTRPPSSSSSAINVEVTERSESKDETTPSHQAERPEGLDKENVKKSAFQPPSPLTSRRSKQKLSTSKKVLSPNRNNQWTRDRESMNASRQPRSSPIHGRQSYAQDRGPRNDRASSGQSARASSSMKLDASGYSLGDLDLMPKDDDFGPPIIDCLNLGSFDTGSPPRDPKAYRRPSERVSPVYNRSVYRYRSSPPPGYPPPPGYYSGLPAGHPPPPGYGYPPSYHSSHYSSDPQPWLSPRAYEYDRAPVAAKPAYESRDASPVSKKSRRWEGTPEKDKSKVRSPFRSPISNPGSAKKFKRSPIWGAGTPSIGMYGSFGMMDTPGAQLDGFSPMGPSFASFEDDSPALPMEGEVLDERLSLVAEDRMRAPPSIQQRRTELPQDSPGFNFINELAHMPGTMPLSSPVRPSRERDLPLFYSSDKERVRDRPPPLMPGHLHSQSSAGKRSIQPATTKRHIFTSPVAPSHQSSANRRRPWYENSRQVPGPVRLELGDMGAKNLETRRSLEGINNMVRGNSAQQTPTHPGAAYEQSRVASYRTDISTPVKVSGPPPNPNSALQPRHPPPFHGSTSMSGRKPVPPPTSASRYPTNVPHVQPPNSALRPPKVASTPSEKLTTPSNERRNPCNCKKSRCLKLYCECFAAELFCSGCNCNDCNNNKEHEEVRNKAMKDTRAKNPNAFKPRIIARGGTRPTGVTPASAHNMGCKCKRSECLKKYCECFQAGVMCGNKCKCADCLNYVGSQALIDKRRKIKDHRGAEFAMQTADDAWKGKNAPTQQPRPVIAPPQSSGGRHQPPSLAPSRSSHGSHVQHHHPGPSLMMRSSPPSHHHYSPRGGPPNQPPHYMGHPSMGHPPSGYPPMGVPMHQSSSHHHNQQGLSKTSSGRQEECLVPSKQHPRTESTATQPKSIESKSDKLGSLPTEPKAVVTPVTAKKVEPAIESNASKLGGDTESTPAANDIKLASMPLVPTAAPRPEPLGPSCESDEPGASSIADVEQVHPIATPLASKPIESVTEMESMESSDDQTPRSPKPVTPRTPAVRLGYDPYSSKKKRQLSPGHKEATLPYFGELPEQPKTTALAVFSFLSNDEIYNAGLVCKLWSRLAIDEELWQF